MLDIPEDSLLIAPERVLESPSHTFLNQIFLVPDQVVT